MQPWENIRSQKVLSGMAWKHRPVMNKTRMFTFLHDIAKTLAEISKMHQQPVWPTKIILRLLAANLSTMAIQLSATSVLIQQNQHGDCKKKKNWYGKLCRSVVQSAHEVGTESFVTADFLFHPEQYANTCMAVLIWRVTCESLFLFEDKENF